MATHDLIALDIDGTLLTRQRVISPRTLLALRAARDDGSTLMLASGRPEHGLRLLAERTGLGLDGLVLSSCNGAAVVEASTEAVICHRTVEPALVELVLGLVATVPEICVMSPLGADLFVTRADGYNVAHESTANGLTLHEVPGFEGVGPGLHKLLLSAEPHVMAAHLDALRTALAGRAETALSAPFYLEVTAPGVDKGRGLLDFCAARGIDPARAIAFGDNENDLPMLRAAGTGVAMGNALPHVKEAADLVTASNDDDGIALVLEG